MLSLFKNISLHLKLQTFVFSFNLNLYRPSAMKLSQSMAQITAAISSTKTFFRSLVLLIYLFQLRRRRLPSLLQMSSSQNRWKSWHQKMIKLSLNFPSRSQKACGLNKITFSSHQKPKFPSSSIMQSNKLFPLNLFF